MLEAEGETENPTLSKDEEMLLGRGRMRGNRTATSFTRNTAVLSSAHAMSRK